MSCPLGRLSYSILSVMIIMFILAGCGHSKDIEKILTLSGDNRSELEAVLKYFKNDNFKYKSACFLIKEMYPKYYYEGWQLDTLKKLKLHGRMSDELMSAWDSFKYQNDCKRIKHIKRINSKLLINNIELACDVWLSRPWHDKYSFEQFCEYVLPYCIEDEPLEDWRRLYYDKYAPLMDSVMQKTEDPIIAAGYIAERLKSEGFDNHADVSVPHLGALYLLQNRVGYCRENCDIALYAMRALGIPISTDFYISSPSYNSRHFWNAIIDMDGNAIPFNYTEQRIERNGRFNRKIGKIYRQTYGANKLKFPNIKSSECPGLFRNNHLIDVSYQYFRENPPLEIEVDTSQSWGFLCLYDGRKYEAIDISEVRHNHISFKNLEDNIIVFPTTYTLKGMYPCSYPILIGKSTHHIFNPDKKCLSSAVIKRKYPIRNSRKYISNMIGGILETSSDKEMKSIKRTVIFKDTLESNHSTLMCRGDRIRYIRYTAPSDKPIEIAELHVYDMQDNDIPISNITANHDLDALHVKNLRLMTDNIWSSFYMSDKGESLIFDLGKYYKVSKILFVPRNDDNFVRAGQDYELFFHDGKNNWKSLGRRKAISDTLRYDNIPINSVLWLRNHSEGIEERPFYIIDGEQIFI